MAESKPRIIVIGVGGAGGNAVNNMIASGITGVQYIVANTDAQALISSSAEHRIQLGATLTEGLGAGAKPERGEAAAEEAVDEIRRHLAGAHMVFIAAGMGGGTGTGAAPVISRIARELGVLTVAIVTKPFEFEGKNRMRMAEAGIANLKPHVDTMIVIPNHNLFRLASQRTSFKDAFRMADDVLISGVSCITELIVKEGLINLDLADVRTVLSDMGTAMMGTGRSSSENRALDAAEQAIMNPLLDDMDLSTARGLIISVVGGDDLSLHDVNAAANRIREIVAPDAAIIIGTAINPDMPPGEIQVSVVASGMTGAARIAHHEPQPSMTTAPFQPSVQQQAFLVGEHAYSAPMPGPAPVAPMGAGGGYGGAAPHWQVAQSAPGMMPHQIAGVAAPIGPALQTRAMPYERYPQEDAPLFPTEPTPVVHRRPVAPAVMVDPRGQMPNGHFVGAQEPSGWMSSEGVLVEERQRAPFDGHPAPAEHASAPSRDQAYAPEQAGFSPQPTLAIRPGPRRTIDVDHFSPHAQAVYRRQVGSTSAEPVAGARPIAVGQGLTSTVATQGRDQADDRDGASNDDPARSGGLLWRITTNGFRRKS